MQSRRHVASVADRAQNEGEVLHAVERRHIGVADHFPGLCLDRERRDAFDELFARLPKGDKIGNRHEFEVVRAREFLDLASGHHRAVVIGEFANDADRRQAGKLAQIDGGFRMSGAHQHPAVLGDQREDMAGPHEVARAHIAIGERAHRIAALLGGNAGGEPVARIDGDGEGRGERRVVFRDHGRKMQTARLLERERRADDAARMADDEGHFLGRAERRGDDEVAFVFAIVVIGDDDDFATGHGLDGFSDGMGQ